MGGEELVTPVVLVAQLLLAVVFAVAGAAKLADRDGSRRAALEFGVPPRVAGLLALALPIAELAVAVALLVTETAAYGALGAFTLLAGFSLAIGYNVARGRSPECHCFGQLHSAPAGARTLARNGGLAVLAGFAAAVSWSGSRPGAVAWLGDLGGTLVGLLVAGTIVAAIVAAGLWGALHALRARGRLLVSMDLERAADEPPPGLPAGTEAPAFELPSVAGGTVALADLLASEHPLLLVFAEPGCGPCRALMPDVAVWQRDLADRLTVAVIEGGDLSGASRVARRNRLSVVLAGGEEGVARAYAAHATPSAVLIDADGTVAAPLARGSDAIHALVDRAVPGAGRHPSPIEVVAPKSEPLADVPLALLEGGTFEARHLRGEKALLVFWNPACGFCAAMRDELLAWETARRDDDPRLVVISSGDPEQTRAEGFRSTVLLDPEGRASAAFDAHGTPMAVVLDAGGRVASPVVAGRAAVLGLAGGGHAPPAEDHRELAAAPVGATVLDDLARCLAGPMSRRRSLVLLGGAVATVVLPSALRPGRAFAAHCTSVEKPCAQAGANNGEHFCCEKSMECCSGSRGNACCDQCLGQYCMEGVGRCEQRDMVCSPTCCQRVGGSECCGGGGGRRAQAAAGGGALYFDSRGTACCAEGARCINGECRAIEYCSGDRNSIRKIIANGETVIDYGDSGKRLYKGEVLRHFGSETVFELVDGSRYKIRKGGQFRIKDCPGGTVLDQVTGQIRAKIIKAVAGTKKFEIEYPTFVMGVRGTEFTASYDRRRKRGTVHVIEGVVEVRGRRGIGGVVRVRKGRTAVQRGQNPPRLVEKR